MAAVQVVQGSERSVITSFRKVQLLPRSSALVDHPRLITAAVAAELAFTGVELAAALGAVSIALAPARPVTTTAPPTVV